MSQNHLTLSFPLKSGADAKALAQELPPLMPDLFRAEDAIGTLHYSRFTVLSDRTLLFLGDFDGDFGPLMLDLAKRAGPVFDVIWVLRLARSVPSIAMVAEPPGCGVPALPAALLFLFDVFGLPHAATSSAHAAMTTRTLG